jgi:hemerythrin
MCIDEQRRSYVDHLGAEHRRLHKMLSDMRFAIASSVEPDEDPSFSSVVRILRQLYQELEHHFSEEDAGGCLEEAVCHCPRLSTGAKRIGSEHPAILAEVNDLIEQAATVPANSQNQFGIQQAFDQLCRRLRAHEAAENQLLSQGFGIPVNGGERDESAGVLDF